MNNAKGKRITPLKRALTIALSAAVVASTMAVTTISAYNASSEPSLSASATSSYRNVMYYGDWSIWGGQGMFYPNQIPADQLTHLNFAFMDFDANGNLIFCDKGADVEAPVGMSGVTWGGANAGILNAFQALRAENPNLKIGVSVGGWSKSGDFSVCCANASSRANLVNNLVKFVKYTNMDFIDIDWEYPADKRDPDKCDNTNDEGTVNATPADKHNYTLLLKDLRAALDKQGAELGRKYELTVALPAAQSKLEKGIELKELFETVDFANMMTYDLHGAWDDHSSHQTGLYTNPADTYADSGYSVDDCVTYLLDQNIPSDKIVIGAAFYSRGWKQVEKGDNAALPGLFQQAAKVNKDADNTPSYGANNEAPMKDGDGGRAGGVWSYRSLAQLKATAPDMKEYWDDIAKAPYMYSESTGAFYTYDNPRSIAEKAKYVKEKNLGGIISWMASQDAPTTSNKRDELTKAIKQGLFGSADLPKYDLPETKLNLTTTIKTYDEPWGGGAGYEISIKNNETRNESGEVLQSTEASFETIKSPMVYVVSKSGATFKTGGYGSGTVTNENGVTIVDLASVYDNQTIAQGATCTFKITSSLVNAPVSDIASIVLVQRIDNKEICSQVLYSDDTPIVTETEETTVPTETDPIVTDPSETDPIITDPSETDPIVTDPIVTDPTETDPIVTEPSETEVTSAPGDTWDKDTVYVGGTVIYGGKTYKAKWWTQGDIPGQADVWELVQAEGDNSYVPGKAYNGGATVTYEGKTYTAKWWTQTEPGGSDWTLVA